MIVKHSTTRLLFLFIVVVRFCAMEINRLKFRAWSKESKKMMLWADICRFKNLNKLISLNHIIVQQFTGLCDKHGIEIYEGDILSDWTDTDEGIVQSKMQVFWDCKKGAWLLDNSFKQDKSSGDLLSDELAGFSYEITGNVCVG